MVENTLLTATTEDVNVTTADAPQAIINRVLNWFLYAYEHPREIKFRTECEEDNKFAKGEQWGEAVLQKLKQEAHPALVINRIKKQISTIVGTYMQSRRDITPVPVDASVHDLSVSKLFKALVKHEMYKGKIQWHFDKSAKESVIGGRGWLWASVDFTRDPINGEPFIEWVPWRDIYCDPDSRIIDKSDATFVMRFAWLTDWELLERYPEKAADIKQGFHNVFIEDSMGVKLNEGDPRDPYSTPDKQRIFVDKKVKRVRVLECWYRTTARKTYLVDDEQETYEEFGGGDEEFELTRTAIAQSNPSRAMAIRLEKRTVRVVKYAVIAGGVNILLDSGDSPYTKRPLNDMLPVVPFVFDEIDGLEEGAVRHLKDPQRETNKRRSKHMHFLNHWRPPFIIADEGATTHPSDLEKATKDPRKIVWKKQGKEITVIGGPSATDIYIHVDRQSREDFFDIGVNPDLLGQGSGSESGRAIMLRLGQGQTQLSEPLTNLEWSYKILGIWLMGLIQTTYKRPKIIQVMGPEGVEALVALNQRSTGGGTENVLQDMRNGGQPESFSDWRNIEYDVVVTTSAFAPTARMAQLAMLESLANAGYPIPAEVLIEATDLPNKHELIRRLGTLTPSGPEQPNAQVQAVNAQTGRQTPQ